MKNIQWNDCSTVQKTAIVGGGIVQFGLLGAALVDLAKRKPSQIQGSKKFWVPFVFVNFIGPLTYFARGRKSEA